MHLSPEGLGWCPPSKHHFFTTLTLRATISYRWDQSHLLCAVYKFVDLTNPQVCSGSVCLGQKWITSPSYFFVLEHFPWKYSFHLVEGQDAPNCESLLFIKWDEWGDINENGRIRMSEKLLLRKATRTKAKAVRINCFVLFHIPGCSSFRMPNLN